MAIIKQCTVKPNKKDLAIARKMFNLVYELIVLGKNLC